MFSISFSFFRFSDSSNSSSSVANYLSAGEDDSTVKKFSISLVELIFSQELGERGTVFWCPYLVK